MNTETKLSRLRRHMAAGEWHDAIIMAAKFGELGAQKGAILSAREGLLRPRFQRQIGRCPDALINAGVAALRERYGDV